MSTRGANASREWRIGQTAIEIGLNAAIVTVREDQPLVLVVPPQPGETDRRESLPFGPFDPLAHRTMEIGLRSWVEEQTNFRLGYIEQLYSFGDRGRHARPGDTGPHVVSVGYLALTRVEETEDAIDSSGGRFGDWYAYFPWEDWRNGRPAIIDERIMPALREWAGHTPNRDEVARSLDRPSRLMLSFGEDGDVPDDERVLERYELLYSAGLVTEAYADGRKSALERGPQPPLGRPMRYDHRRILATAMGRLRGKLKYRPVVFELMPPAFTLTDLQKTVEAIAGRHLHKQNFRRLVEQTALVEPTGRYRAATGGRPAQLFRFRREVLRERPAPGLRFGMRG